MELTDRLNFWTVVTANLSYWVAVAINISDFTRYVKVEDPQGGFLKRNKISIMGQLPGITIGMTFRIRWHDREILYRPWQSGGYD